ncbi:MAG: hypothetical protein JRJ59_02805, partial [Deltaproteobacteria bacterium]|nr:hypothetical protein [Deltaproteobacteria bacterium]
MRRLWAMASLMALFVAVLWWTVFHAHEVRKGIIFSAGMELEMQAVQTIARAAKSLLEVRLVEQGLVPDKAGEEVFRKVIKPIRLLESGRVWLFSRGRLVLGQDSDLPGTYRNKDIGQIFELQKEKGAAHYQRLVQGITKGSQGAGWYVWLPDRGREQAAWTSFSLGPETWTVVLSIPESKILV